MFTTKTACREQALKAVAAAQRAMERHACSKSQFKFKCFSCGKMIHRGDKITRCMKADVGQMSLRYRGAGGECGLTMAETAFYQGESGKDMWVHIGCNPCYWDEGFDNGDESSPPGLRGVPTEWGYKVDREFEDWTSGPGGEVWFNNVDLFLKIKGYPKEKSMRARIFHAITRFQALWRGYIYKKAYPIARLDAPAKRVLNEAELQDDSTTQNLIRSLAKKVSEASGVEANWLQSGEGGKNEQEDAAAQNRRVRNEFLQNNSIGGHVEILFDERRTSAAIYSAEIIKIQGLPEIDGLYYWVKFHHDEEVRRYHWKRLLQLKVDCGGFKSKHGIIAEITGKLPIAMFYRDLRVS